jgi:hypothetical protein
MTLAPVVIKDYREVKPENLREYYEIQKGGSLPYDHQIGRLPPCFM